MTEQMTLPIRERRDPKTRARLDAVHIILVLRSEPRLQGRTAADLAAHLGEVGDTWTDRRLRAAAEASGGALLSAPGCPGYRLAEATPVKSYYAIERSRMMSQIDRMRERVLSMDRAVHRAGTP